MKKIGKFNAQSHQCIVHAEIETVGYPIYPESEDIYYRFKKEKRVDPDDITKEKEIFLKENEMDFIDDFTATYLDITGTDSNETDDVPQIEDEEICYFSLGVDDHLDIDQNMN